MATTAPAPGFQKMIENAKARGIPLSVLIELTHRCNLDCAHCYLGNFHGPGPGQQELTTEELYRLLDELAEAGTFFLTLSGGEIMVRRDWLDIARYARRNGFALKLFTNGTLLTPEKADAIRDLEPLLVEISLYGSSAEIYEGVTRRRRSFRKVREGIELLVERGVPTVIKSPIMTVNVADYHNIARLAEELGVGCYFDAQITPQNDNDQSPCALSLSSAAITALYADPLLGGMSGAGPCYVSDDRLNSGPCGAGRRLCTIGPYGGVFACNQMLHPAGNIREQPFAEIWRGSPWFERIRGIMLKDIKGCVACPALPYCSPCLGLSLLEVGNLDGLSSTRCRVGFAKFAARDPGRWEALGRPGGELTSRMEAFHSSCPPSFRSCQTTMM